MNDLQLFNFEDHDLRMIMIDDDPWWIGKDVAEILGYSNSRKALGDHVDEEDKGVTKCYTLGGTQEMTVVNESGLYSLIFSSKLERAKRFKRWVTSEVLPQIRKNGSYSIPSPHDVQLNLIREKNQLHKISYETCEHSKRRL